MSPPRRYVLVALAGGLLLGAAVALPVGAAGAAAAPAVGSQAATANATNVSVTGLTVWTAPRGDWEVLTNGSAIRTGKESGTLTRDGTVAPNDTLVLELRAPGLDDRLAAVDGPNDTVRFFRATGSEVVTLWQTDSTPEISALAARPNGTASTRVVADTANDTYYLAIDTAAMRVGLGGFASKPYGSIDWDLASRDRLRRDTSFVVSVWLGGRTTTFRRNASTRAVEPVVHFRGPEARFGACGDRDRLLVGTTDDERIRARTSLAPGTDVTVRLANRSDGGPPIEAVTTVTDDAIPAERCGRDRLPAHDIRAGFDATGLAPNATFDAEVLANDRIVGRSDGVARPGAAFVRLAESESWRDWHVNVTSARLPEDGFLVVQMGNREPLAPTSSVRYRGHTSQPAGTVWNLSVQVDALRNRGLTPFDMYHATVIAVRDRNDNGLYEGEDESYVRDGDVVAAVARVDEPNLRVVSGDSETGPLPSTGPDLPSVAGWTGSDGSVILPPLLPDVETGSLAASPQTSDPNSTRTAATPGSTSSTSTPSATVESETGDTRESTDGSGAGFGPVAAVSALVAAVVLVAVVSSRRRE